MTFPQEGDRAVDYRAAARGDQLPRIGPVVTIDKITGTLIITSDGGRYRLSDHRPVAQGRFSDRQLIAATDDRVLVARGREMLAALAATVANLAKLDHTHSYEVLGALGEIGRDVVTYRKTLTNLMVDAVRQKREQGEKS